MQQEKQEGHVGEAPPTEDGVVQKRASISSDSKTGQTDEIPSKGCRGDSDAENPSTICHSAETTPAGGAGGRDISSACITCDWFKDLIIQMYRNSIRPDAIFATSDPIAFIVIHALHNLHVAIPSETAVISIDNVSLSQYIEPPLTTINQPLIEMGAVATNQLLRQIEYKKKHGILPTPETSFLDYDLIVRQST